MRIAIAAAIVLGSLLPISWQLSYPSPPRVSFARAEDGPGAARVRAANDAIVALLRQKPEPGSAAEKQVAAEISKTVGGFLDISALGKSALVDHWGKLSRPQQAEFSKLLASLVENSYVRALRSNLDYEVKYQGETVRGNDRVVTTEVSAVRNGRPQTISVEYVLRPSGGALRAVDVVTDGVGIVENYRAQFNKIIAKEGFQGLIERMRKKQAAA
jgi:phospholipid transport system substrate-binding protein